MNWNLSSRCMTYWHVLRSWKRSRLTEKGLDQPPFLNLSRKWTNWSKMAKNEWGQLVVHLPTKGKFPPIRFLHPNNLLQPWQVCLQITPPHTSVDLLVPMLGHLLWRLPHMGANLWICMGCKEQQPLWAIPATKTQLHPILILHQYMHSLFITKAP